MRWFKQQFGADIVAAVSGTPFSLDLLTAIAVQETFEVWGRAYKTKSTAEVLELCTGDVIGEPKRKYFPRTKAELLAHTNGDQMYAIAREALTNMAAVATEYQKYVSDPRRFCHAFGIFQYDLQFLDLRPSYFLNCEWHDFGRCLQVCIQELREAQGRTLYAGKSVLNDTEMVHVAIAYNAGRFDPKKGFQQGHYDGKKYYGEYMCD